MSLRWFLPVVLAVLSPVSASLPRIAVLPHRISERYPADEMVAEVVSVLENSGRFELVDAEIPSDSAGPLGNLPFFLRDLASESAIDLFLLIDCGDPMEMERTVTGDDSLITYMTLLVDVSGRFYSSSGSLIGSIRETGSGEGQAPYLPDAGRIAVRASRELAERALLELFPVEISFVVGDGPVYEIPEGGLAGLRKGMILSLVATSPEGFPEDLETYDMLRSRGILQVTRITPETSSGRLLSGELVEGGEVVAVEQGSPAIITLEYHAIPSPVERVEDSGQLEPVSETVLMSRLNAGGETCKWGLGFGGAITTGTADHVSTLGIRLTAGPRIPVSSPSLAFRFSAGGEATFYMQDVRNDTLSSSTATSVSFGAVADAELEWLFSDHLGLSAGATGRIGSDADTWTVQDENGYTRDALPWEVYYSRIDPGAISARAGLFYVLF
jgi:hypothetical protein